MVPDRSHLDRFCPLRRCWNRRHERCPRAEAPVDSRIHRSFGRHCILEWNWMGEHDGSRHYTGKHCGPHLGRECDFLCLHVFWKHRSPARHWSRHERYPEAISRVQRSEIKRLLKWTLFSQLHEDPDCYGEVSEKRYYTEIFNGIRIVIKFWLSGHICYVRRSTKNLYENLTDPSNIKEEYRRRFVVSIIAVPTTGPEGQAGTAPKIDSV